MVLHGSGWVVCVRRSIIYIHLAWQISIGNARNMVSVGYARIIKLFTERGRYQLVTHAVCWVWLCAGYAWLGARNTFAYAHDLLTAVQYCHYTVYGGGYAVWAGCVCTQKYNLIHLAWQISIGNARNMVSGLCVHSLLLTLAWQISIGNACLYGEWLVMCVLCVGA